METNFAGSYSGGVRIASNAYMQTDVSLINIDKVTNSYCRARLTENSLECNSSCIIRIRHSCSDINDYCLESGNKIMECRVNFFCRGEFSMFALTIQIIS